ncbi:MAG: hypothetical protein IH946_08610, partial [Bacteroidetes bacterium]|nr:hypothetical protein [Bacteroidota bacterium]
MQRILFVVTLILSLNIISTKVANATHIVGGELRYECIDANLHIYKISMRLFRDCSEDGTPAQNASFDDTIYIAIYDQSNTMVGFVSMEIQPIIELENPTYNECLFAPQGICVQ